MKERPILFSGPMIRALLGGSKTQTRRLVDKDFPTEAESKTAGSYWLLSQSVERSVKFYSLNDYERLPKEPGSYDIVGSVGWMADRGFKRTYVSPYGIPGDRLWVRETHGTVKGNGIRTVYRADGDQPLGLDGNPVFGKMIWRPSIFMRRADSRLTLEITSVRAERLQSITDEDIRAEGMTRESVAELLGVNERDTADASIRELWGLGWDAINGKRATWLSDPWCWVIGFRCVEKVSE